MIKIISVGRKHESWIAEGIERFVERLRMPFVVEWEIVPHAGVNSPIARDKESSDILGRIDGYEFVILLDEDGENIDSVALADKIGGLVDKSIDITFIIGGAYGVNPAVKSRANFIWSLSRLVFPHQLVRLMLVEQIYRAEQIYRGTSYHHGDQSPKSA